MDRRDQILAKLAMSLGLLDQAGLQKAAQMVSLTGQAHMHENLVAPGVAAHGQIVDVAITPLGCGAVTITFDDVTHRRRN